jgi:iron(III) transport system permease protein
VPAILLAILLIGPIVSLILTTFESNQDLWIHLTNTVLPVYVVNTLLLFIGVVTLSALLGVSTAWIVTYYSFEGKKIIEWALILPLACPAYIIAYLYTDFLEYAGPIQGFVRYIFDFNSASEYYFPEIRSVGGAIFVMGFVLYPYVYILARTGFNNSPRSLYETAGLYGKNKFLAVGLPLCRPYIVAGLALVAMEVLSDFGTVEYFSVQTLTLGMFNVWIGMNSISAASQIAIVTFVFIIILLILERRARSGQKYNDTSKRFNKISPKKLSFGGTLFANTFCLIPISLGFIVPMFILLNNVLIGLTIDRFFAIFPVLLNTIFVGLTATLIIIFLAFFSASSAYFCKSRALVYLYNFAATGYALPGTMLAIGVVIFFGFLDTLTGNAIFLGGTIYGLIFALMVRFYAIPYGGVTSGYSRIPSNLFDASKSLGYSSMSTSFKVTLPLVKASIIAAAILTFVDIVKELPMTLILRPFNFETLATYTYQFAHDELMIEASLPAFFIIFTGLIPVFLLQNQLNKFFYSKN